MILKDRYLLKYKHPHVFCLKNDQNALNHNPKISKLLSLGKIFESRFVFDKLIISYLWTELYTLRRTDFGKFYAAILLWFQWKIQSKKKLMGQRQEFQQKRKGVKNFDTCFSVIFSCYNQIVISGYEIGHLPLPPICFEIFLKFPSFLRS